ncbi:threalose-6-phosphate phosphatase [Turnera subulata]|uniref:Threalose-6-phosphate phosphatase n=1 Tax=Turnera subulata TaxID=218843 RepID=A0A9Q0EYH4_9ROSI|nr:threalose-6-phosphate phosphatase [Turnera subulata]
MMHLQGSQTQNKMHVQASKLPISTQNSDNGPEVTRRVAHFHPSIWGDRFLSCPSESAEIDGKMEKKVEELKKEVKRMMVAAAGNKSQILNLIDLIQRLGVAYHFETEIDKALSEVLLQTNYGGNEDDLHIVSLQFRLLRQQGFNVSCDVFNNFMDGKGNLKQELTNDVQAILSLYEATHLRFHGEQILDELLEFTTKHLKAIASSHLSPTHSSQVSLALRHPIRKSLQRVYARQYLSIYEEDAWQDKVLLALAKLDFNRLQKLHLKELSGISRWWKDLDFAKKLPFARDRVVESYVWMVGVFFEPHYSLASKILCKVINIASIIDDIYDAYGTPKELPVLTEAIERWDIESMAMLPEYMKLCYGTLLDIYEEIERDLEKQGRSYLVHCAREEMKKLVRYYFKETEWLNKDYTPTMEEYLRIALPSCGFLMLVGTSFLGMGDIVTKDTFDWIAKEPKIIKAASIICRLMDDIAGHEFEQKRGHAASSVECYMKQYGEQRQKHAMPSRGRLKMRGRI